MVGRLSKGEQEGEEERFFRRFRSQIIFKYTSYVYSDVEG